MVNPQITNLVIMLGMMQVSKKIPFEDPNVLMGVRALYIVSNLLIFGVYYYITTKIQRKKGKEMEGDLTTLKYLEPPTPGSGEDSKLVTTTIMEYDLDQVKAAQKQQMIGLAMMGFLHIYMKYTNPLVIQSIIPLKGVFEGNIAKVHLFGKPAVGELKRPWKTGGAGFMGMGGAQGDVKTDKASIEAAERAGRGGAKEE